MFIRGRLQVRRALTDATALLGWHRQRRCKQAASAGCWQQSSTAGAPAVHSQQGGPCVGRVGGAPQQQAEQQRCPAKAHPLPVGSRQGGEEPEEGKDGAHSAACLHIQHNARRQGASNDRQGGQLGEGIPANVSEQEAYAQLKSLPLPLGAAQGIGCRLTN